MTTRLTGSAFKNALAALPIGGRVEIEGPYGSFVLREGLERVAFLAGGIGITCVRSMLRWSADTRSLSAVGSGPPRMVLLFANRSEGTIPFREELERLSASLPGLRVVHVLSHPDGGWGGRRGHIDGDVLAEELPDMWSWTYYLSGPPSFVEAISGVLRGRKISPRSMKMERFDGYE